MAEIIPVQQFVYNKERFSKVVNTQFSELNVPEQVTPEVTVEEFFRLYEELFYNIPKEGDINSHRYILEREAEYLGVQFADDIDIQALLQEITDLRQQLLAAETQNARLEDLIPIGGISDLERSELLAESGTVDLNLLQSETLVNEQSLIESTLANNQDALVTDQQELTQEQVLLNTPTNPNLTNNSTSSAARRYNPLLKRFEQRNPTTGRWEIV